MKVLQINSVCGTGSTGRIVIDIQNYLIENHETGFIMFGRNESNFENSHKFISNSEFKFNALKDRFFDRQGFYFAKSTKKMIDKIEEFNPDIIHLHNIHGYYIDIKTLFNYLKDKKIKVVWTLHDCWSFTGHCAHYSAINCQKWQKKCFKCPQKKEYPKSILLDNSFKNFKDKKELFSNVANLTLVTPSNWLKDEMKKSFLRNYKCEVISNGIDIRKFDKSKENFKKRMKLENKFIVLGVSNIWDHRKGLNDFIELSKMIDDNYRIVLIGLSEEQISKLPQNIIGLKKTESIEELCDFYTNSDVLFTASLEETFGLTILEAALCNTKSMGYNSTAVGETLDLFKGEVFEKNDLNSVLKFIKSYSKNEDFLVYDKLAKEYSSDNMSKKYYELYKKVLGE